MTYRYFAYGSTLDAGHLADWCREHGIEGFALAEGQPAVLDDFELALTVPSRYWMGAVGTLEPRPGAAVYGVLFELADADADTVRHKEGVATGLFRELDVEVRLWGPGGDDPGTVQLRSASAFRAAEGRAVAEPPPPSRRWLEIVARGAGAWGLPRVWIDKLGAGKP